MKRKLLHALALISATHGFAFGAGHHQAGHHQAGHHQAGHHQAGHHQAARTFCPDILTLMQIQELKANKKIVFTHGGVRKKYIVSLGALPNIDFRINGLKAIKLPHQDDAQCTYKFRHFGRPFKGSFTIVAQQKINVVTLQDAFNFMGLSPDCLESEFKRKLLILLKNRYNQFKAIERPGHEAEDHAFNVNFAKAHSLIKAHFARYYEEHKDEEGVKAPTDRSNDQEAEREAFAILGLPNTASFDEVKKAYRWIALKNHPDKNPDPAAHQKFKDTTDAYEILKNKFE